MLGLANTPLAASTASSYLSFRNHRGTLSCLKKKEALQWDTKINENVFIDCTLSKHAYFYEAEVLGRS